MVSLSLKQKIAQLDGLAVSLFCKPAGMLYNSLSVFGELCELFVSFILRRARPRTVQIIESSFHCIMQSPSSEKSLYIESSPMQKKSFWLGRHHNPEQ